MKDYAVYIRARNTMEHSMWALRVTLDSGSRIRACPVLDTGYGTGFAGMDELY